MAAVIYVFFIVAIVLWLAWKLATNNLFNLWVLWISMAVVTVIDLILLIFTYDKINGFDIGALIMFFLCSLVGYTGWLARTESTREAMENRRMTIDYWQDVVIDTAYVFMIIQIVVIFKAYFI